MIYSPFLAGRNSVIGPHTNRFFHAKRPMDVWGEGVKGLDVFKIFNLSTFFPRIFCKKLYSALSFAVYIYS